MLLNYNHISGKMEKYKEYGFRTYDEYFNKMREAIKSKIQRGDYPTDKEVADEVSFFDALDTSIYYMYVDAIKNNSMESARKGASLIGLEVPVDIKTPQEWIDYATGVA